MLLKDLLAVEIALYELNSGEATNNLFSCIGEATNA